MGEVVEVARQATEARTTETQEDQEARTRRRAQPQPQARPARPGMNGLVIAAAGAGLLYVLSRTRGPVQGAPAPSAPAPSPVTVPGAPPIAAPGAPVSLTQVGSTTNSVDITWAPVEGAVSYQIWQVSPRTLLGETTTNQATIGNLQPNSHYEIFVVAIGATGLQSPPSQPLLVSTASTEQRPTLPGVPGALEVRSVSPTSITFSWQEVPGATYYQITNVTTGQVSAPIRGTQATISGLSPNTVYSFSLQACNEVGCGNPSVLTRVTTSVSGPPTAAPASAPSSVQATSLSSTEVTLVWSPVPGATTYTIVDADTGTTIASGIQSTQYTIRGLQPGATLHVAVEACNDFGCSPPGAAIGIQVPGITPPPPGTPAVPAPPEAPIQTNATANSVTFTWRPVAGATYYEVYHSTGALLGRTTRPIFTATRDENGPLAPNSPFHVYIVACNNAGCSRPGEVGSLHTAGPSQTPTTTAPRYTFNTCPILRQGARGSMVLALQRSLDYLGFSPGPPSDWGAFGPRTEAAVRAFQQSHGLAVDGIVGPQTYRALDAALRARGGQFVCGRVG